MSKNLVARQLKNLPADHTLLTLLTQARAEGPLTEATIDQLAEAHHLPPAWIRATAEFYDTLSPGADQHRVQLCQGEACRGAEKKGLRERLRQESGQPVGRVTCVGLCAHAPAMLMDGEPLSLAPDGAVTALIDYLNGGDPLTLTPPITNHYLQPQPLVQQLIPAFLPNKTEDALVDEVVRIVQSVVDQHTPASVRRQIAISQLRGRGGAGFPMAQKLEMVAAAPVKEGAGGRYVVINGDEGDAGSYIDKALMEDAPHLVLAGGLLTAYGVGAKGLYLYVRHEYPQSWRSMSRIVHGVQALLPLKGRQGGVDCTLHLVKGQGAYVCGEETSLLRSIEGLPPQVSVRPPYPAQEGLYGCPTAVQNVETVCNLPTLFAQGADRYAATGTEKSRGTKLISLNSAVQRPGLYEAPFGTPIRTIIEVWAGGVPAGRQIQGVQIGGPLGAILPPELLDTPLSFEHLAAVGGTLGHGSMVVFDDRVDLLTIAHGIFAFGARESCGKCFPCRLGSVRGEELLRQMYQSGINPDNVQRLQGLCETLREGSLCGLGGMLPTAVESLIRFFPALWFIDGEES
ncbi:MAG: NAD(P)H-dependent oxidoreductase subunit E [Magnetococcales bacterium]|nr:NAD(P)H-dependent oxidoreductase subunit E [Magnetococcales bacterium]